MFRRLAVKYGVLRTDGKEPGSEMRVVKCTIQSLWPARWDLRTGKTNKRGTKQILTVTTNDGAVGLDYWSQQSMQCIGNVSGR